MTEKSHLCQGLPRVLEGYNSDLLSIYRELGPRVGKVNSAPLAASEIFVLTQKLEPATWVRRTGRRQKRPFKQIGW